MIARRQFSLALTAPLALGLGTAPSWAQQAFRPGKDYLPLERPVASDVGPSAYARCFHNVARAAELLSWWRSTTPDYVEIAYTARHIAKEAELWPTMAA